jgi:hypothetical protein
MANVGFVKYTVGQGLRIREWQIDFNMNYIKTNSRKSQKLICEKKANIADIYKASVCKLYISIFFTSEQI